MQTKNKTIGQRIRYLRIENNMTQKALAKFLYVSESTVSGWERDRTEPSITFIIELSVLFHASLNYLLIGNEKITP